MCGTAQSEAYHRLHGELYAGTLALLPAGRPKIITAIRSH
jgi:hypothetical protein